MAAAEAAGDPAALQDLKIKEEAVTGTLARARQDLDLIEAAS
ncbi:MAG TPA: hypothetical protein PKA64_13185 [Myxococcota bacterium]|nr:hypothetical protein [Myxococcota bacterium]